jgi:hypothetical protein
MTSAPPRTPGERAWQHHGLVQTARRIVAAELGLIEGLRVLAPGLHGLDPAPSTSSWARVLIVAEASTEDVPLGAARARWDVAALAALDARAAVDLAADRARIDRALAELITALARPLDGVLYGAGPWVVCGGAGVVVALRARRSGAVIGYCPRCACAWPSLGAAGSDDALTVLSELAPDGVEPPGADELLASAGVDLAPLDLAAWGARLPDGLASR